MFGMPTDNSWTWRPHKFSNYLNFLYNSLYALVVCGLVAVVVAFTFFPTTVMKQQQTCCS